MATVRSRMVTRWPRIEEGQWVVGNDGVGNDGAGFAVWRRWPDGMHDLIGPCPSPRVAQRRLEADRRYWRRSAWRPVEYRVVAVSRRDFDLHRRRRDCRAPDCP
jgi:hypothetical protein